MPLIQFFGGENDLFYVGLPTLGGYFTDYFLLRLSTIECLILMVSTQVLNICTEIDNGKCWLEYILEVGHGIMID